MLFMLWGIVGYLLALPATFAAMLEEQNPPQHVEGFAQHAVLYGVVLGTSLLVAAVAGKGRAFVWWLVGARALVLAAAATLAVLWVEPRVASAPWNARSLSAALTAGAVGLVFSLAVRWWDRNRRHRPVAGQIWLALVPFRESGGALPHYCVVMRTRRGHAEVLQITTKNKDGRDDHIRTRSDRPPHAARSRAPHRKAPGTARHSAGLTQPDPPSDRHTARLTPADPPSADSLLSARTCRLTRAGSP
ncbi:hypothetical protein [Streptomyces sp. NPDC047928]|uniref:hypothetical protein n=1 Tax=unclassified Streptomyces TaxID=2593676 RepID=UPI003712B748